MRDHKLDIDGPPFVLKDEWQSEDKVLECLLFILLSCLGILLVVLGWSFGSIPIAVLGLLTWVTLVRRAWSSPIIWQEETVVDTDGLLERRSLFGLSLWTRRFPWEAVTQLELTQRAWLDFAPKRTLRSCLCLQLNAQKRDPCLMCTVRPERFLTVAEFVRRMSPREVMCDSRLNSYLREKELTLSERYVVSRPRPWGDILVPFLFFCIGEGSMIYVVLVEAISWPGAVLPILLLSLILPSVIAAFRTGREEFEISASGVARTVNGVFMEKVSWDHIQKAHLVGVSLLSDLSGYGIRGLLLHCEDRKIYVRTQDHVHESEIIQFVNAVCPEYCERNRSFLEHIEHCELMRSGIK